MATRFDSTLQMSNSTDALFRAWAQFIHDTLISTGGWVDPGDTGQLTISGATKPVAINTKVGYRMYRMADSLQGSFPVFMRLDYGSGTTGAGLEPGVWVTIGTGSNGSGTITGITYDGGSVTQATFRPGGNATSACNSYGSADTSRIQLLMFVRAAAIDMMAFSLERTKDASGNDTGDGLLMFSEQPGSIGQLNKCNYIVRAGGSQPPVENGLSFVISNQATSAFTGDVGVGIPILFKGIAQQPGTGIIVTNSGDFLAQAVPSLSLYGSSRTYQLCDSSTQPVAVTTGNGAVATRSNTRVGIRYD